MGAWIWEPTVTRLRDRGLHAEAITLHGLGAEPGAPDPAGVGLATHVQQVVDHVVSSPIPVVLVSHSYSGVVAAQAADRAPDRVAGLVHFGGFLPTDGRSLLDDWGTSDVAREQEEHDIVAAGNLWPAPSAAMLQMEPDLSPEDRDHLSSRFRPHPGSTIREPARMGRPVEQQPTTYVGLSVDGEAVAWQQAPPSARGADHWRRRTIASGHWPMVSRPEEVARLLVAELTHYAATPDRE